MKAFLIDRYGGPEVLVARDIPLPEVGANDLLVRVRASGVNPVDFKIRDGMVKILVKLRFPAVLGNELSGVVARIGTNVTGFKEGDEVFARLAKDRLGAFAEFTAVDASLAVRKPANLTHVQAASIPLVGLTSWQALVDTARLQSGQKVLIHAGSGGVGTFALQLAKHLGATVLTTASARNADLVRRLGADVVIDYKNVPFESMATDCDVVFDTQGGDILERSFSAVKRGGIVVTISGNPDGKFAKARGLNPIVVLALRFMMRKVTTLARSKDAHFEYLFMRPDGQQLATIAELLSNETIKPVVDRVFPFDQTAGALAYVESGKATGKVVIEQSE
ncbi:MAG TPA: NADP-dependent oxidoreductase [Polyangiaceae bacterium]|nr:NADP-dependent oxidoreductase [Polyangiaceae bacterium]